MLNMLNKRLWFTDSLVSLLSLGFTRYRRDQHAVGCGGALNMY